MLIGEIRLPARAVKALALRPGRRTALWMNSGQAGDESETGFLEVTVESECIAYVETPHYLETDTVRVGQALSGKFAKPMHEGIVKGAVIARADIDQ